MTETLMTAADAARYLHVDINEIKEMEDSDVLQPLRFSREDVEAFGELMDIKRPKTSKKTNKVLILVVVAIVLLVIDLAVSIAILV
jgi:hypothetical protein